MHIDLFLSISPSCRLEFNLKSAAIDSNNEIQFRLYKKGAKRFVRRRRFLTISSRFGNLSP